MNFQSAITALAGTFISLYLGCVAVGRPDLPWKMIAELRGKALEGANSNWGCPSVFNGDACQAYDPKNYRTRSPRYEGGTN
jgi:hypothetical protein